MKNFIVTLFLGAAIGFGCAKVTDQPVVANNPVQSEPLLKPGALIGVVHFELEEGADSDAFGEYLNNTYFPAWKEAYDNSGSGITFFPLLGERGEKEGQYGALFIHPSLDVRNQYFPADGFTEAFQEIADEVSVPIFPDEFDGYVGAVHLGDQLLYPFER